MIDVGQTAHIMSFLGPLNPNTLVQCQASSKSSGDAKSPPSPFDMRSSKARTVLPEQSRNKRDVSSERLRCTWILPPDVPPSRASARTGEAAASNEALNLASKPSADFTLRSAKKLLLTFFLIWEKAAFRLTMLYFDILRFTHVVPSLTVFSMPALAGWRVIYPNSMLAYPDPGASRADHSAKNMYDRDCDLKRQSGQMANAARTKKLKLNEGEPNRCDARTCLLLRCVQNPFTSTSRRVMNGYKVVIKGP